MLLAQGDGWTTAVATCVGTLATMAAVWISYKLMTRDASKTAKEERHQRDESLKAIGRKEVQDEFARDREEKERQKMIVDLAALKKVVNEATDTQSVELKQTQKTELGHIKKDVEGINAKLLEMRADKGEEAAEIWKAIHGTEEQVKKTRHDIKDSLQVILNGQKLHEEADVERFAGIEQAIEKKIPSPTKEGK